MFEGGILKAGIPEELVRQEMVHTVYLGQNFELRKKKLEFYLLSIFLIISNMNIPEKPSKETYDKWHKDLIIGNTVCFIITRKTSAYYL
jgi:hypothetical protein